MATPLSRRPRGGWILRYLPVFLVPATILGLSAMTFMPADIRIPMAEAEEDRDEAQALFRHWEHGEYGCYACHPSLFPQARQGFTHKQMKQGQFCGACHDGKTAFDPDDDDVDCTTCHVEAR